MYYRRRRNSNKNIIIFCLLVLFGSLSYGYYMNQKEPINRSDTEKENIVLRDAHEEENGEEEEIKNEKDIISETLQGEEDYVVDSKGEDYYKHITKDTEIIFNTYYKKSGEMRTVRSKVPVTIVGLDLKGFRSYIEDYYDNWVIKSISPDAVTLFQEREGYAPDQFIVQERNGLIVVYKVDDKGEKVLQYETDISVSRFNEIDRKKLKEGILVKDFDEALSIIQDYSS